MLLDATAIPVDRGGVGRYLDALAPELVRQGLDLVVVAQAEQRDAMAALLGGARVVAAPAAVARRPVRLAWEQIGLPALVRRVGADVLHSPHYTLPRLAGVPVVVTLHDAIFFSDPGLYSPVKARFFQRAIRTAVRRASRLVVPSAATRDEVLRYAGGAGERFVVAPHGVDPTVFAPPSAEGRRLAREAIGLPDGEYVAFLGTLEPRKNLSRLVRAWVDVAQRRPDPPALVLAGGRGWDSELDAVVADVPDGLVLRRPGYLPLESISGYLAEATVVAYPSLGEGFGLPVLEAMACGAAVLTTRRLSLPEVGGDAVEYCEPDESSIADGLERLLDDGRHRAELGAAALERAAGFTWAAAAQAHVRAYREALEG